VEKFKKGEKVYHKATEQEGVVVSVRYRDDGYFYEVRGKDGEKLTYNEDELYSEEDWKELAIPRKAEQFNSEYENYIDFLSSIYDKRYDFSRKEEKEYLTYHNKLRTLFLDIQSPLVKFLEEEYVVDRNRPRAFRILGEIEECFKSPSLDKHFSIKPEKPEPEYYYKQIIEHFVSYLRSIK